jgi:hypothetical protein
VDADPAARAGSAPVQTAAGINAIVGKHCNKALLSMSASQVRQEPIHSRLNTLTGCPAKGQKKGSTVWLGQANRAELQI